MKNRKVVVVNARIPLTLKRAIEEYVRRDCHINFSDFYRDSLREKLERDAPWLLKEALISKTDSATVQVKGGKTARKYAVT